MEHAVEWRTVDYGQAVFHVASYSSEAATAAVPDEARSNEQPQEEPCPLLSCVPFYRCWTASRSRAA